MSTESPYRDCATTNEMEEIFYAIKNKENILASYEPPCDYMKVSVGIIQQPYYSYWMLIKLIYMDENYQEIVNTQDFGFESFWSGVGGFVGIFLGYSLLQFPDVMETFLVWCSLKLAVMKSRHWI